MTIHFTHTMIKLIGRYALAAAVTASFCFAGEDPIIVKTGSAISPSLASSSRGLKRKVAIARFTNETAYGRSFLVDEDSNPIGKQAVDILSKKLLDSGKFILLERAELSKINAELSLSDLGQLKNSADYLIVGSITAFGRKTEGKVGIFTRKKKQIAYAKVTIRLVDVQTGQIIYAEEGSGEAYSEVKTSIGMGPTAGYDSTLNDKVLDAAITNLASRIIENLLQKPWRAYILTYLDGFYMITGSRSQGLHIGDKLDVLKQGRKVRNPQTGMDVFLPAKKVGELQLEDFIGDASSEVALAVSLSGTIPESEDSEVFKNFYLGEPQ